MRQGDARSKQALRRIRNGASGRHCARQEMPAPPTISHQNDPPWSSACTCGRRHGVMPKQVDEEQQALAKKRAATAAEKQSLQLQLQENAALTAETKQLDHSTITIAKLGSAARISRSRNATPSTWRSAAARTRPSSCASATSRIKCETTKPSAPSLTRAPRGRSGAVERPGSSLSSSSCKRTRRSRPRPRS